MSPPAAGRYATLRWAFPSGMALENERFLCPMDRIWKGSREYTPVLRGENQKEYRLNICIVMRDEGGLRSMAYIRYTHIQIPYILRLLANLSAVGSSPKIHCTIIDHVYAVP